MAVSSAHLTKALSHLARVRQFLSQLLPAEVQCTAGNAFLCRTLGQEAPLFGSLSSTKSLSPCLTLKAPHPLIQKTRQLTYLAAARLPVALLKNFCEADSSTAGDPIQSNKIHGVQDEVLCRSIHWKPL